MNECRKNARKEKLILEKKICNKKKKIKGLVMFIKGNVQERNIKNRMFGKKCELEDKKINTKQRGIKKEGEKIYLERQGDVKVVNKE